MKLLSLQDEAEGPACCSPQGPKGRRARKGGLAPAQLELQRPTISVLTFRNIFNSGHEGLPGRSWD